MVRPRERTLEVAIRCSKVTGRNREIATGRVEVNTLKSAVKMGRGWKDGEVVE